MGHLTTDELLTTTRAVRKRLDLTRDVDPAVIRECLEIAIQAPSGSNRQGWRFLVITDPEIRAGIAGFYRRSYEAYRASPGYAGRGGSDDPDRVATQSRVADSADHLAAHLHEVPVLLLACIHGRPSGDNPAGLYGSILPAVWSFMLAARDRGLGTAWTTLHLAYEREVAELCGIPYDEVTQAALIPVAHHVGDDFGPAPRAPLSEVVNADRWDQPAAWV
ncbi:nitroreductase family protein [Euzebya sp.]|uniref:nitroreductase family protein n=1 Tax=Euzebya sp. TaxID=1971409 RepID=UPI003517FD09